MPLILVTNDDGVYAPGLRILFRELHRLGRPVIIAPERDNSAVSHALTMNKPLKVRKIAPNIYTIDGTPADCVTLGIGKILPVRPGLIVSGINPGGNLGDDVSYSGTVSAAIEGTMLGVPSLAVSLAGEEEPFQFEAAAQVAADLARLILGRGLPTDTLLNVNIPNLAPAAIKGVKFTRQGRRIYDGAIKETFDPRGKKHFWIGGGTPSWDNGDDTDSRAVMAANISITPIHLDLTNYAALKYLRESWRDLQLTDPAPGGPAG